MAHTSRPDYLIGSAADIRPESLLGINPRTEAMFIDFDCCVATHGALEMPPDSTEMLIKAHRAGIMVLFLTNVYDEEARARQDMIAHIKDPRNGDKVVRRTIIPLDATPPGFEPTDFKKPKSYMPRLAIDEYHLTEENVFMIGDQERSDMKCVADLDVIKVLVDKRGKLDHPVVKLNRPFAELHRLIGGYSGFPEDMTSIEDWMAKGPTERHAIDRTRRIRFDQLDVAS